MAGGGGSESTLHVPHLGSRKKLFSRLPDLTYLANQCAHVTFVALHGCITCTDTALVAKRLE